jgi:hypothetical protein
VCPPSRTAPNLATLDYLTLNTVAARTGQPVLGPPLTAQEAAAADAGHV